MEDRYPLIKFHVRGGGSITVISAAQEKALGPEWVDKKVLTTSVNPTETTSAQDIPKRRGRPPKVTDEGARSHQ